MNPCPGLDFADMTQGELILRECRAAGLTLARRGDALAVAGPPHLRTPERLAALRKHKGEILARLDCDALSPDCRAWVGVANRILRGEFDAAPRCAWQSLWIGVRAINHPACLSARAVLRRLLGRPPAED